MTDRPMQRTVVIASFFKRLETLGPVVGIIMSEKPISALITLQGRQEKKVHMDFSARPARVAIDGEQRTGHIYMTIDGHVLHDVLLGRKDSGVALGRREMILRGSAHHLSRFIPLFDFSPVLYRQHLSDIDGMEETMTEQVFKGDPIEITNLSWFNRAIMKLISFWSFVMGFMMGFLRFRVFKKINLLGALAALSRGIEAAAPKHHIESGVGEASASRSGKTGGDNTDA